MYLSSAMDAVELRRGENRLAIEFKYEFKIDDYIYEEVEINTKYMSLKNDLLSSN
jgi:hypothetical protein